MPMNRAKITIFTGILAVILLLPGCDTNGENTPKVTPDEPLQSHEPAGSQHIVDDGPNQSIVTIDVVDDRKTEAEPEESIAEDEQKAQEQSGSEIFDESKSFYAEPISDELFERMKGKSFPDSCTTSRDDLRYLHLLYKDIDGVAHEGEMISNASIAASLIGIFRELYENDYPIEKMVLIDDYGGDDDLSMADNNTSCFNFREVSGTGKLSRHAYGLAVDLNPRYNPYIHKINGETLIEPENGTEYANRDRDFDYKIDKDDLAYKLFTEAGFTWGGSWKNSKDYQHFQMQ